MRIGVGGFCHETNTFSPVATGYEDFRIARGDELIGGGPWVELARQGHALVPLLRAGASPSGWKYSIDQA